MKVIDISRELFSTPVYPGDPEPRRELVRRMELGDSYNLSGFYTGCHSATHVDAPRHFIDDGKTVDELDLSGSWGAAQLCQHTGLSRGPTSTVLCPIAKRSYCSRAEGRLTSPQALHLP